jgi:peptide/nickel transport system permease protein
VYAAFGAYNQSIEYGSKGPKRMTLKLTPRQRYFANRLKWYIFTFVTAITLTFVLPRLGPVDPVDIILSKINTAGMSSLEIQEMRAEYNRVFHLDKPVWQQYLFYLGQTLKGDLGTSSINYPSKCWDLIKSKIPWSLLLILPTILLAWFIGNILGALAAYKRGVFDKVLYPLAQLFTAVPFFCFGLILVFIFYSQLEWAMS